MRAGVRRGPAARSRPAYGSELNQVWTNLIDNAAGAIRARRSAEGVDAAGQIVIRAINHDDGVLVEVTDDGEGIDEADLGRVFDSFFTTKEPGKGTGLGLHISRQIVVVGHEGNLTVQSRPGHTTFQTYLPAAHRRRHAES